MKEKNTFFGDVFTRELNRWKALHGMSQEDFAAEIGVEPNMITRYKQGRSLPSQGTMAAICRVLRVEPEMFHPRTVEEFLRCSRGYQAEVESILQEIEEEEVSAWGIRKSFWEYLWTALPELKRLLPGTDRPDGIPFLFQKTIEGEVVTFDQQDMAYLLQLQEDVIRHIRLQAIHSALEHQLSGAWPGNPEGLLEAMLRNLRATKA